MAAKLNWEVIEATCDGEKDAELRTQRAKVRGGWLVAVCATGERDRKCGGGLTFVPDPKHKWSVSNRSLLADKPRGGKKKIGSAKVAPQE